MEGRSAIITWEGRTGRRSIYRCHQSDAALFDTIPQVRSPFERLLGRHAEHTDRFPILFKAEVIWIVVERAPFRDIPIQSMRPHWPITARRLIVIRLDTFDLLATHPLPIKTIDTVPPHARIRTARFVWGAKFVQRVSIRTMPGSLVPTRPTVSAQFNLQEVSVAI